MHLATLSEIHGKNREDSKIHLATLSEAHRTQREQCTMNLAKVWDQNELV